MPEPQLLTPEAQARARKAAMDAALVEFARERAGRGPAPADRGPAPPPDRGPAPAHLTPEQRRDHLFNIKAIFNTALLERQRAFYQEIKTRGVDHLADLQMPAWFSIKPDPREDQEVREMLKREGVWPDAAKEWFEEASRDPVKRHALDAAPAPAPALGPAPAPRPPDARTPTPPAGLSPEAQAWLEVARKKYAEALQAYEQHQVWWGAFRPRKRAKLKATLDLMHERYERVKGEALKAEQTADTVKKHLKEEFEDLAKTLKEKYAEAKGAETKNPLVKLMRVWERMGVPLAKPSPEEEKESKGWLPVVGRTMKRVLTTPRVLAGMGLAGGAFLTTTGVVPISALGLGAIVAARGAFSALASGTGNFELMRRSYEEAQKRAGRTWRLGKRAAGLEARVFATEEEAKEKLKAEVNAREEKKGWLGRVRGWITRGGKSALAEEFSHAVVLKDLKEKVFQGNPGGYKEEVRSRIQAYLWRAIAGGRTIEQVSSDASFVALRSEYEKVTAETATQRAGEVSNFLHEEFAKAEDKALTLRKKERGALAARRVVAGLAGMTLGGAVGYLTHAAHTIHALGYKLTGEMQDEVGQFFEKKYRESVAQAPAIVEAPKPAPAPVEVLPEAPKIETVQDLAGKWGIEANVIAKARETWGFLGDDDKVHALIDESAVKRGDGIESGLLRQLGLLATWKDDPKVMEWFQAHGYDGKVPLEKFTGRLAHRIAMDQGYVTGDGKGRLVGTYWNAKLEAGEKVYRVLGEDARPDGSKGWAIIKSENLKQMQVEREYKTPFYPHKAIVEEAPGAAQTPPAEVPAGPRPPEEMTGAPRVPVLDTPVVEGGLPPAEAKLEIPDTFDPAYKKAIKVGWDQMDAYRAGWERFKGFNAGDPHLVAWADAHIADLTDDMEEYAGTVKAGKVPAQEMDPIAVWEEAGGKEGYIQRRVLTQINDELHAMKQIHDASRDAYEGAFDAMRQGKLPVALVKAPSGRSLIEVWHPKMKDAIEFAVPEGIGVTQSSDSPRLLTFYKGTEVVGGMVRLSEKGIPVIEISGEKGTTKVISLRRLVKGLIEGKKLKGK